MRNSVSEGLCGRQVTEVRLQLPAGLAAGGAAGSLAVVVVVVRGGCRQHAVRTSGPESPVWKPPPAFRPRNRGAWGR